MGKIVSIHSFRGGTGKSNITANMAAQAAISGKRVGIVDADIQSPGIHALFGLDKFKMGPTLNEYLHGKCSIKEIAFSISENPGDMKGHQQLTGTDLWLIPSSIELAEISKILKDGYDPNLLNEGLQNFIKTMRLDYLFIDTHPGLNDETLYSITISDILIIILRPDQQDYQGTAVTVDIAQLLDVPQIFLVVNKALSRYGFNRLKQEIERTYETPVAGVLPLSEDLAELGSAGLFSLTSPDHPWSLAIRGVAEHILKNE